MIVGENPRSNDIPVNPTKAKQLTNFRSQGDGKGIQLSPPIEFSLERSIEYIAPDEFVEATPSFLRLRKRILNATLASERPGFNFPLIPAREPLLAAANRQPVCDTTLSL